MKNEACDGFASSPSWDVVDPTVVRTARDATLLCLPRVKSRSVSGAVRASTSCFHPGVRSSKVDTSPFYYRWERKKTPAF